ncbi:phage tail protein [Xanthomonas hortorum]|uniref:Phage tail protein n=1 Tax=Xanthomonas hortorum pv. pelargonii TaxID=453602 RepID=A0A6V7F8Y1_9XANT|nr:tail fiber protein [Xanthomonas hortorum]MCE4355004.1 tail fiber protein [Xanthomonas hortorum pv. pelargonii]MCM5522948.1 tail fiber protein [Xanthomonas hortorum pv. pelargonii]MCM5535163.1 tail fiber protein [Xanthomonas hortorum pv. pelargonii]MCM5539292.1 tail fiber protein [Xanthomonas hortorum pv. pelargonii]MCM5543442.1 tail fiber protein [Xanthomonas hortorum pv. pelargonii]
MSIPFIGEIRMFGFTRTPVGWQACDGSLLSIPDYDVLYMLLGTTYGGDGQSTFGVPDLRGRLPIHQGQGIGLSNYSLGQISGTETVTLIQQQLPLHTHTLLATTAAATSTAPAGLLPAAVSGDVFYVSDGTGSTAIAMAPQSTSSTGGGQPHENTMPTLTVQFCIATAGVFPQQS